MKGLLSLLKPRSREEQRDSTLFTTAFANLGVHDSLLVSWEERAVEAGATRLPKSRGGKLLQSLWARDRYMAHLDGDAVERMERFFTFAAIPANRDLILQDEYGNFMVVLLTGSVAVDREQPWGERLRLAETQPGDILGEMSLLDSGIRLSSCTTLTDCEVAVLGAAALDDMMAQDAQLAASLVALLARKLSLRLRGISARLNDNRR